MPRQEESEKQYHWPIEKQYRDLYCWCGSENALREIAFTQELLRKSFARTKPPNPASITLLLALIAAQNLHQRISTVVLDEGHVILFVLSVVEMLRRSCPLKE